MKTFAAVTAAVAAALALSAGSAQAGGHVNWSIGINLPPIGAVVSNGPGYGVTYAPAYSSGYAPGYAPGYSSGYEPAYGPGYGAVVVPAPVYAPPPVVVYRQAPPVYYPRHLSGAVYAPLPIAYGAPGRWQGGRGWRDDRRDGRDDGRWAPAQRDERRQRH